MSCTACGRPTYFYEEWDRCIDHITNGLQKTDKDEEFPNRDQHKPIRGIRAKQLVSHKVWTRVNK